LPERGDGHEGGGDHAANEARAKAHAVALPVCWGK
jgi:hypothetical protein